MTAKYNTAQINIIRNMKDLCRILEDMDEHSVGFNSIIDTILHMAVMIEKEGDLDDELKINAPATPQDTLWYNQLDQPFAEPLVLERPNENNLETMTFIKTERIEDYDFNMLPTLVFYKSLKFRVSKRKRVGSYATKIPAPFRFGDNKDGTFRLYIVIDEMSDGFAINERQISRTFKSISDIPHKMEEIHAQYCDLVEGE